MVNRKRIFLIRIIYSVYSNYIIRLIFPNVTKTKPHQLRKTVKGVYLISPPSHEASVDTSPPSLYIFVYSFTKVSEHEDELRCTKKLRWPKGENTKYKVFC